MKIVIATPILYEASSPFNHLFKDIIGGFLKEGHQVFRFVAVENKKQTEYKYSYTDKNISYKLYYRKNSNHRNIISRYLRDSITNIRQAVGLFFIKNVDVLFEDVSYSSFWPVLVARIKGIKIVSMLQDVWPDNAVQSKLISEGSVIYKYFEMWQRFVYKQSDKIICISDDMKEFIVSKGVKPEKIEVIYNWGYSDDIVNISWEENQFVKKYALDRKKFYAVYAGNIGKMQNVEIIVNAAKNLQEHKNIHFLIVGDGACKNEIEESVRGLENVTMFPMQPSDMAIHIYSAASVNIIPLVKGGTKTALPSKIGVVLSCGKSVLFTFGSDSKIGKIINDSGAGASVDAEDYIELSNWICKIAEREDEEIDKEKDAGYQMFKKFFMRSKNIKKYAKAIIFHEK